MGRSPLPAGRTCYCRHHPHPRLEGRAGLPAKLVESSSSRSPPSAPSALPILNWPDRLSMVNRALPLPSLRSGVSGSS